MTALEPILYSEDMVGKDSPDYDDTLNRALLQVVDLSGADDEAFVGFALRPVVAPTVGQFYRATDTGVGASWQTLTAAMVTDLASAATGITKLGTVDTGVWNGTSIATTYTDAKVKTVTGTSNRLTISGTATDPVFDISSAYVGQATITTLGTIISGAWTGTSIGTAYTDAKVVSITGTSNRLTVGGTATVPVLDISAAYVGQTSIVTLGTVTTGTWTATAIADTYLATISTAGKVANTATTAASANTLSAIVTRDGSGNFAAGTITAALTGNVTGNVTGNLTGTVLTAIQNSVTTMAALTTVATIGTGVWQGTSIGTTYTDAKVTSISGTSNRVTIGGTATVPVVDISSSYVGQATITTLGTISAGVWNGTIVTGTYGGTGVNNGSFTITVGGNLSTSSTFVASGAVSIGAAFTTSAQALTLTLSGSTNVTLPTSGTLITSAVTSLASLTTVGVLASPHMTGAVVDSGGLTVTTGGLTVSAGTTAVAALTATTISGTVVTGTTAGAFGTNVASAGIIRLQNATEITWRNVANNGNIGVLQVDAFDGIVIGDSGATIVAIRTPSGVAITNGLSVGTSISSGTGDITAGGYFVGILKTPSGVAPANASASGAAGTFVWDTGFLYICTATNTWKRVAVATW